tara:strand:- start:79 stop:210 length:132 start_codon:yes stop_codon:yes gene_type:complete
MIYEALQIVYTFIPKELLIIIMATIIMYFKLEWDERKDGKKEK